MTLVILVISVSVIQRQDKGLNKLDIMYRAYNDRSKRHISCSEFKTYMEELDVEVQCNEHP